MASSILLISGSPLIGCPIVYSVQPAAYDGDRTFHRIIVRIHAKLETDSDYTTFDFSTPVETKPSGASYSTQPSQFDISSALRAVADKYEYTPEPPERYPYIKFRIEAWDEWMVNGNVSTNQGVVNWPSAPATISGTTYDFYGYAFMGAFNDMERMKAGVDQSGVEYLNATYLSRKPNTSPEVVFKNSQFIYPAAFNRGIEVDHMSDGVTSEFVSGAPTFERNVGIAYRYDNVSGQTTTIADNNAVVLLPYSDIETDNAYKVCKVNPPSEQNPAYSIRWESHKANLEDVYLNQQDGHIYVATSTGWLDAGLDGPKSVSYIPSAVGAKTVGSHDIYVINHPDNGYELRFINGMGVMESVHVTAFAKKESNIHTEKYVIARQETLKKFSRALTVKTEDYDTWTLSTGPLDEDWVSWYVHEFLMSQVMWIGIVRNSTTTWIPCHVLPEETITLRDAEKASIMSVQFKIQLDINGSFR